MNDRKNSMEAILLCFVLTLFPFFDLPVFWPVLVVYFVVGIWICQRVTKLDAFPYHNA